MSDKKFLHDPLALVTKRSFALAISLITLIFGRASLSNTMNRPQISVEVPVLSAPVEGVWRVVNSPGHAPFAYDLAAINTKTGSTLSKLRLVHIFGQVSAKDFYSWEKPVRSPVTGRVVEVSDNVADRESLNLGRDLARMLIARPDVTADDIRAFAGNYIILDAKESTFTLPT